MFISLYVTFSAICGLSSNLEDGYDAHDMETVHTVDGYEIHPDSYQYVTARSRSSGSVIGKDAHTGHEIALDFLNTISMVNITFTFREPDESPSTCGLEILLGTIGKIDPYEKCVRNNDTPTEQSFDCRGTFTRKMLIFTLCRPTIKSIIGFDTFLENYIGCFQTDKTLLDIDEITGTTFDRHDPKSCALRCHGRSHYLGLNSEENCYCIDTLDGLIYIKLALCEEGCRHRKHFCGNEKSYLSIYLTRNADKVFRVARIDWNCFRYNKCWRSCPKALHGYNCEFKNCSIDNGLCANFCSNFTVNILDFGVCRRCGDGTIHMDNCPDFDECKTPNICSDGRKCYNTLGSFECRLCDPGFIEVPYGRCTDIDECSENVCDRLTTLCNNDVGSFTCNCLSGFKPSISQFSCEDVDECGIHSCGVNTSECVNTPGSFHCFCFRGYQITDRLTCKDIDECGSIGRKCPDGVLCINSIGSYDCLCPEGTIKREFLHATECDDIDECAIPDLCNLASSFCINTIPFYVCVCRPRYVSVDNFTCEPKNVSHTEQTTLPSTTEFSSEDDLEIYYIYFGLGFIFILILLVITICTYFCCKQTGKPVSMNDSTLASGTISSAEHYTALNNALPTNQI